ncbi:MAG: SMEK domain-containing protein, partial [Opitutae bacterium]|nr:SMEK domain-containing protein [Opitutae bacterium]
MPLTRPEYCTRISDRLNELAAVVKSRSRADLTDANRILETISRRFFNVLFGWQLENLNLGCANHPAIDLGDRKRRLSIQVTNESASGKITETKDKAVKYGLGGDYDRIVVFFLLPTKPSFPGNFIQPAAGPKIETWDIADILRQLQNLDDLNALMQAAKVLDEELGRLNAAHVSNILTLFDYQATLAGFREFLTAAKLPFQAPSNDSPYHPEQLLRQLGRPRFERGVLLAGVGGVGKTRTSYEVALLAAARGWRVLYVLPGQPLVSTEQLLETVLAPGHDRILIIVEYLDQMLGQLDFDGIRRHLTQASAQRGITIGLLANCRPAFRSKNDPMRDALLDIVELQPPPDHADRLSRHVVVHAAPTALNKLGEDELMRLCGRRPIIALLVARQLERLALNCSWSPGAFAAVRTGDLSHWLRRRLAEDGLAPLPAASPWEDTAPPPHLVAAAAALACAPDDELALGTAAEIALQVLDQKSVSGPTVIGILAELGWLEREGAWLQVVHDVVADEVIERCITGMGRIRPIQLHAVLSPARSRSRSLGRIAKTITRVGDSLIGVSPAFLRTESERWFHANASTIGVTLAADIADNGSYALGAILGGSLFETAATDAWEHVIAPWLKRHAAVYEARHLLYRALRLHTARVLSELVPLSMVWIDRWWGEELSSSFVLAPLLARPDLSTRHAARATDLALAWLDRFHDQPESRFVLAPLLARPDLSAGHPARATDFALAWLDRFHDQPESRFVLAPLLARPDLSARHAAHATDLALAWLDRFHDQPESRFVLAPLLARP